MKKSKQTITSKDLQYLKGKELKEFNELQERVENLSEVLKNVTYDDYDSFKNMFVKHFERKSGIIAGIKSAFITIFTLVFTVGMAITSPWFILFTLLPIGCFALTISCFKDKDIKIGKPYSKMFKKIKKMGLLYDLDASMINFEQLKSFKEQENEFNHRKSEEHLTDYIEEVGSKVSRLEYNITDLEDYHSKRPYKITIKQDDEVLYLSSLGSALPLIARLIQKHDITIIQNDIPEVEGTSIAEEIAESPETVD